MASLCYSEHMTQTFISMLAEDGKKNSLGRVDDVIIEVLDDPSRIDELYNAMFHDDAWVRMRAADAFEKICRVNPIWIEPYIDRIQADLDKSQQASIQWHIAQIYCQIRLDDLQKKHAIDWLARLLKTTSVDWIVAANCMKALEYFVNKNEFNKDDFEHLLRVQLHHKSKAVAKKAQQFLNAIK